MTQSRGSRLKPIHPRVSFWSRFTIRLFMIMMGIALVPFSIAVILTWRQTQGLFVSIIGSRMADDSRAVMTQVNQLFGQESSDLSLLADTLQSAPALWPTGARRLLSAFVSRHPEIARVFATDLSGRVRVSTETWDLGREIRAEPILLRPRLTGTTYFSAPQFEEDGRYVAYLSTRLPWSVTGRPVHVLVAVIDLNRLRELIPSLGETLEIHVVDDRGRVVLSSHPAEAGWQGIPNLEAMARARSGQTGYTIERGPHGPPSIIGFSGGRALSEDPTPLAPVTPAVAPSTEVQSRWVGLVSEPTGVALRPITRLSLLGILGLIAVAIATSLLARVLSRSIAQPLHDLTFVARAMGEGDLHVRVSNVRSDEFGELSVTFNQMADRLAAQHRALEEINRLQRERYRELESFIYTISHDLKTPVVSMQGYLALLYKDPQTTPEGRTATFLARIRDNVAQLEAMLRDLLQLAQLSLSSEAIEPVDLSKLVADLINSLAVTEAPVDWDIQHPLGTVHVPPRRFGEALGELLANACQFRSPDRPLRIALSADRSDDGIRVNVEDNGIGIAPAHRERVFRLFERLAPVAGTTRGVGLARVKKIVESVGGRVWIESGSCEIGTRIVLWLPETVSVVGPIE